MAVHLQPGSIYQISQQHHPDSVNILHRNREAAHNDCVTLIVGLNFQRFKDASQLHQNTRTGPSHDTLKGLIFHPHLVGWGNLLERQQDYAKK